MLSWEDKFAWVGAMKSVEPEALRGQSSLSGNKKISAVSSQVGFVRKERMRHSGDALLTIWQSQFKP